MTFITNTDNIETQSMDVRTRAFSTALDTTLPLVEDEEWVEDG